MNTFHSVNALRESLTVFAIFLIVILSAALAVPYLVDWNAERGLVERQLSALLGRPVTVKGGIDLKLLPTPYLRLAKVQVGDAKAGSEVAIDEVRLEIALPALLRGEVDFVEARLVRPQLATQLGAAPPFGQPIRRFSGQMRFERISVEDGRLSLDDPETGRKYRFTHISFDAEAASLTGPFKAQGRFSYAGKPSSFSFAAGERTGNRQSVKLIVDENEQHPRADLDANLTFPPPGGLPSVTGQMKLSGHMSGDIALPWRLAGSLTGGRRKAAIRNLDLHFGDEDHGVDFTGAADFDFGTNPRADATLKARQLDLDRLLAAKGGASAMEILRRAASDLVQSSSLRSLGVPITVAWSANAAVLGGETLNGLSGGFSLAAKQSPWLRFEGDGPGGSHLLIDGNVETGPAAGFKGHVEASTEDVPRLTRWLAANLPQETALVGAMPVASFDVAGTVNLSRIGFVGRDLSLRLGQSVLSGTLAYTAAVGGEPARLFADLSAAKVDVDSLPNLPALAGVLRPMDLSLRFFAQAVHVGAVARSRLDAGQLTLRLEKTGALTQLQNLAVEGLGGANITAHSTWDGKSGTLAAALDSARLDEAAALLHRLVPGPASDALVARAGELSPAKVNFSARAVATKSGEFALKALDLKGTAGGTKIAATVAADPKSATDLTLSGVLTAPDGLRLLSQIGLPALPLEGLGAGALQLSAHGAFGKPLETEMTAALAGTTLAFNGLLTADLKSPRASGTLRLASPNLTPLFEATGLAFPGPATRIGADFTAKVDAAPNRLSVRDLAGRFGDTHVAGTLGYDRAQRHLGGDLAVDRLSLPAIFALAIGEPAPPKPGAVWSSSKFPPAMIDPPATDFRITAKRFELSPQLAASDASFDLSLSGDRAGLKLALQNATLHIRGGDAAADVTLRRDGANVAVAGRLKASDYGLALPSVTGKLGGALEFAGTGDSMATLVAGLAGSGTLDFQDLALPDTDPAAMARVFEAVETDSISLDGAEIDRALQAELRRGVAHLGTVDFGAELAAGVLRLSPKGSGTAKPIFGLAENVQARVDLSKLTLDQATTLTLLGLPRDWKGPPPQITVNAKGPLAAPARSIESASFVNALAARAIARESARIQAQEFDLHEQAFFYNRLKSERRREEDRLKAEDAAKKAEAAKQLAAKLAEQKRKADEARRSATPLPIVKLPRRPPVAAPPIVVPPAPTDPLAAGRY